MALSINNLIGNSNIYGANERQSSQASVFGTIGGSGGMLGDYASIKNGSYHKLLKAYYANDKNATTELTETETKNTTEISSDMAALKKAADALRNGASLFEEGENGVDKEAIAKAVKGLADAFNSAVDSTSSISITAIDKKMSYTAGMLAKNAGLLEDVGVKYEDGKLTVNEEKLKNADTGKLKTLFNGANSIAARLSSRAADVYSISQAVLGKPTGLYTETGTRSTGSSTGSLFNATL